MVNNVIKKFLNILKKVLVSAFAIYGYNLIASPLNLIIPINIITILLMAIFGFPALFSLILILIVVF